MVFIRGWGAGEEGEEMFNGDRLSILEAEEDLEMNGSDGYTTM